MESTREVSEFFFHNRMVKKPFFIRCTYNLSCLYLKERS